MRIVIAEDSAVIRAGLAEVLTNRGHEVVATRHGVLVFSQYIEPRHAADRLAWTRSRRNPTGAETSIAFRTKCLRKPQSPTFQEQFCLLSPQGIEEPAGGPLPQEHSGTEPGQPDERHDGPNGWRGWPAEGQVGGPNQQDQRVEREESRADYSS